MQLSIAINRAVVNPRTTYLFIGAPGIGKTFATKAAFEALGYDTRVVSCQSIPDEDIAAMPEIKDGVTHMRPNAHWVPRGDKPMAIILDEYAKATSTVKNSLTPLLHGFPRTFQGIEYPSNTVVVVTSNPPGFGLGDRLKPHEINRMCVLNIDDPTYEDAESTMLNLKFDARIIEWARAVPAALISYLPEMTGATAKESTLYFGWRADKPTAPFTSMRALHNVSHIMATVDKVTKEVREEIAGAIGQGAAQSLCSYLADIGARIDVKAVLSAPEKAKIPKDLMPQRAAAVMLAMHTTPDTFAKINTYVERMHEDVYMVYLRSLTRMNGYSSLLLTAVGRTAFARLDA